jgi:transposase
MRYIQGEDRKQIILFPESLDEYISEDNPVRVIDVYVDSLNLKELGFAKAIPAATGRPPYNPGHLLKLALYCYIIRVRSSRRQKAECMRNVEAMWLMDRLVPDHRVIAAFRSKNPKPLRNVFKVFTKFCLKLNLFGKELAAIDGSKFEAVNSNDKNFNREKLKDRIERIDAQIEKYMNQLDTEDAKEAEFEDKTPEEIQEIIGGLKERKAKYQQYEEELKTTGARQISETDPDSRRMKDKDTSDMCYNVVTSVDSEHGLIGDYAVTNDPTDINLLSDLAKSTAEMLEADNLAVTADKGFNNATEIAECLMAGITPHVAGADYDICLPTEEGDPEPDEITKHHEGRSVYLKDRNVVVCPMGKTLYPRTYIGTEGKACFYNIKACANCICRCTTSNRYKDVRFVMPRNEFSKEYNDTNLHVKQVRVTPDKEAVRLRKTLAEHPFGTIKRNMDAGYVLTKGIKKVDGEFALTFFAYNFKRVINIMGVKNLIKALRTRHFFIFSHPRHSFASL